MKAPTAGHITETAQPLARKLRDLIRLGGDNRKKQRRRDEITSRSSVKCWLNYADTNRTPVNDSTIVQAKAQTVQAAAPEKVAEVQPSALTEQKTIAEPAVVEPAGEEPAVEPQTVSHPIGCENYRHLISQYDWNIDTALQIAHAESGCNPSAVGDNFVIAGIYAPSCGLFQVRTLSSRPPCDALKDPATNIEWAYRIYQGQGYGAWSVCSTKVSCW